MMTFGALLPCDKCEGQFELGQGGYVCSGNIDEWVKCLQLVKEPKRVKCKFSRHLRETYSFLERYKPKVSNRVIKYVPSSVIKHSVKKEEGTEGLVELFFKVSWILCSFSILSL